MIGMGQTFCDAGRIPSQKLLAKRGWSVTVACLIFLRHGLQPKRSRSNSFRPVNKNHRHPPLPRLILKTDGNYGNAGTAALNRAFQSTYQFPPFFGWEPGKEEKPYLRDLCSHVPSLVFYMGTLEAPVLLRFRAQFPSSQCSHQKNRFWQTSPVKVLDFFNRPQTVLGQSRRS